jgi:hypothetical protein
MQALRVVFASVLCTALTLPAWAGHTGIPVEQIKLEALMTDTQKTGGTATTTEMVWWLPPQLWAHSLAQQKTPPDAVSRRFQGLFERYTVIAVLQADNESLVADFTSEADLRPKLQLVDMNGGAHRPIAPDKVDPALKTLLGVMRPILVSLIGPAGENMQFYVFPGRTASGKAVADPLGDGKMLVRLDRSEFSFRLPLGSLLPPRRDPANGEAFQGDYRYNPYTGAALQLADPGR